MKRIIAVIVTVSALTMSGFAAQQSATLTNSEVKQLMAGAATPEQHLRLARHFEAKADKLERESKEHADMARGYRVQPTASELKRPGAADTVSHCQRLSDELAKAAHEARALAAAQEAAAK